MLKVRVRFWANLLLAACLAGGASLSALAVTPGQPNSTGARLGTTGSQPAIVANSVTSERQALMLRRLWGIDEVHVRYTASGAVVRFSYRVVDVNKARVLNDKNVEPYLLVKKNGAKFQVPSAEKVGKLRQTPPPENGREYWMVFTNVRRTLVPGDHVEIVIGNFRADELVVESPR
jgi:hypothetical protein